MKLRQLIDIILIQVIHRHSVLGLFRVQLTPMTDLLRKLQFKFAEDMSRNTKQYDSGSITTSQYKKNREKLTEQYFIDKESLYNTPTTIMDFFK